MDNMINYYELLHVDSSISMEELKEKIIAEQRKWLGRTNAPDLKRRQEAERMVQLLEEAQATLLDENKRKEYNKQLQQSASSPSDQAYHTAETQALNPNDLIEEAWKLMSIGRVADAIVAAKRATELNSGNAEAWATLARAHYFWNEFDDAVYEYKKAISMMPNNAVYYYDLSDIYIDHPRLSVQEKLQLSEELIQKAIQIQPNEKAYLFRMANILMIKEHYDKAINILKNLIETHGEDTSVSNELARAYYQKSLLYQETATDRNNEDWRFFVKKEAIKEALELLTEAERYTNDSELLQNIRNDIKLAKKSLKLTFLFARLFIWGLIPAIWFLFAMASESLINILISGFLLYIVCRKSILPIWKYNREAFLKKPESWISIVKNDFIRIVALVQRK